MFYDLAILDMQMPGMTGFEVLAKLPPMFVKDVARWSGRSFVMDPAANTRIQIFSPRSQTRDEAYMLFLTSLSVVNLRAVQVGQVVKIVPVILVIAA